MRNIPSIHVKPGAPRWRVGVRGQCGLTLLTLALAACSTKEILKVEDPDVARPTALQGKSALPTLLAGTIGEFGNAYNGAGNDGQVTISALLADEFINTETFPTRLEIDQRSTQTNNGSLEGYFFALSRARAAADLASARYAQFDPTNASFAEVLALGGVEYVLFAENWCSGVPFSTLKDDGSLDFGAPLTRDQMLDRAVAKFDSAITIATTTANSSLLNLARVGKGRALLDKGSYAAAATAVTGVPTTFQYQYLHSETTGRQNNVTWSLTNSVGRFGIADREGGNGLLYKSEGDMAGTVKDPRIPNFKRTNNGGNGFDNTTPQWIQNKYLLRASPITVADGVEARLIEAENALQTNDIVNFLAGLTAARTARGALPATVPALVDPGSPASRVDLLFKERAYDLWLTSHRLGDLRRLIRQYGRNAESVFPTGPYFKGGLYGTDVNLPVPFSEKNNPQYVESACKQNVA